MKRLLITLIAIFSLSTAWAEQVKVSQVLNDADISFSTSDLFRSLRSYEYLQSIGSKAFFERGINNYLQIYHILSDTNTFIKKCSQLSSTKSIAIKVNYICGRILITDGLFSQALDFLSRIPAKTPVDIEVRIVKASAYIGLTDGESCIDLLPAKMLPGFNAKNFGEVARVMRGRCYTLMGSYEKAIGEYQEINSQSRFYLEILEESAWTNFKLRRLETASALLDILISIYENGASAGGLKSVEEASYFRAKYLQAYIQIFRKNAKYAEQLFDGLQKDLQTYIKKQQKIIDRTEELAGGISADKWRWKDSDGVPFELTAFTQSVQQWNGLVTARKLEDQFKSVSALTKELGRSKDIPNAEYVSALNEVKKRIIPGVKSLLLKDAQIARQNMKILELKARMGKVENIWIERTEGMRSVDELLDTYKQEVDSVDNYLGGVKI